jgi:RNA-binding protein YhbY
MKKNFVTYAELAEKIPKIFRVNTIQVKGNIFALYLKFDEQTLIDISFPYMRN